MLSTQLLSSTELAEVFQTHMTQDFPADELKPLEVLQALQKKGVYRCYGFYDKKQLVAYALLVQQPQGSYLLLDYLAVCAPFRSHGYGSQCLQLLKEACQEQYHGLLAELEQPEMTNDAAEKEIRQRRIGFYERNGLRNTNIYATLFQVPFTVYYFPFDHDPGDARLFTELDQIYCTMFPAHIYAQHVQIYQE